MKIGPVDVILAVEAGAWPPQAELEPMVEDALSAALAEAGIATGGETELGITFTDDAAIAVLNRDWRGKPSPTNVLSFPVVQIAPGDPLPAALGDIVLAFETVKREAELDEKPFAHHLVHLVVHGFLHLLGHDHIDEEEAEAMEAMERRVLERLAIGDPYA
jgi:probable rRNA maturation factor